MDEALAKVVFPETVRAVDEAVARVACPVTPKVPVSSPLPFT